MLQIYKVSFPYFLHFKVFNKVLIIFFPVFLKVFIRNINVDILVYMTGFWSNLHEVRSVFSVHDRFL